jgi:hypothetical protein
MRFNPPPTWPSPPEGWVPPSGWRPAPDWPPAPNGWQLWVEDETETEPAQAVPKTAVNTLSARSKLGTKANAALDANLDVGESVEVIILGSAKQAIVGSNRRAFVHKQGYLAGAAFGAELTSWDYRNIVGIQIHTGMMSGAVIIQAPGQSGTKTSYWGSGDSDVHKAPNAIPLNRPFQDAQAGVAKLRQLISAIQHPDATAQASSPFTSERPLPSSFVAEELGKLAKLHREGVLNDDEFAELKRRLLA